MSTVNQTKIWDYFQGEGVTEFQGAAIRLSYLVEQARRLTGNRRISVLNIGVGDGFLERKCVSLGWDVHAIDPSQVAIDELRRKGIAAKVGLVEALPYKDDSFDVVFCSEVFEHLTPEQFAGGLIQIRRVLKNGGVLIGSVPFEENMSRYRTVCPGCSLVFHRWGHQQSFTASRIRSVLEDVGLQAVKATPRVFVSVRQGSFRDRLVEVGRWIAGKLAPSRMSCNLCFTARKVTPSVPRRGA